MLDNRGMTMTANSHASVWITEDTQHLVAWANQFKSKQSPVSYELDEDSSE